MLKHLILLALLVALSYAANQACKTCMSACADTKEKNEQASCIGSCRSLCSTEMKSLKEVPHRKRDLPEDFGGIPLNLMNCVHGCKCEVKNDLNCKAECLAKCQEQFPKTPEA
eukprot:TRINITY_DN444_c0_g1_i2.p1 TRINITY_DN444_c0_g1~~TRINITY_DN444_c0_g1_i2.p1  ORF type:complete len:113 (-),score=14.02 TRINITY_DN444_c0_g1_i2:105-443(-)